MTCNNSTDVSVSVPGLSIHGSLPASYIGVRWYANAAGGIAAGALVSAYTADGGTTVITPSSSQRFWIRTIQVVVALAGNVSIYRGTSVSADATVNNMIAKGALANNGGLIIELPWVRLGLGEQVYIKAAGLGQVDFVAYGALEST